MAIDLSTLVDDRTLMDESQIQCQFTFFWFFSFMQKIICTGTACGSFPLILLSLLIHTEVLISLALSADSDCTQKLTLSGIFVQMGSLV